MYSLRFIKTSLSKVFGSFKTFIEVSFYCENEYTHTLSTFGRKITPQSILFCTKMLFTPMKCFRGAFDICGGGWGGIYRGVTVVQWLAHVPFTSATRVRFLLGAVIRLKFHLSECFQFDSTKHRRFSPSAPVSSCTNTGPNEGWPLLDL